MCNYQRASLLLLWLRLLDDKALRIKRPSHRPHRPTVIISRVENSHNMRPRPPPHLTACGPDPAVLQMSRRTLAEPALLRNSEDRVGGGNLWASGPGPEEYREEGRLWWYPGEGKKSTESQLTQTFSWSVRSRPWTYIAAPFSDRSLPSRSVL